MRIGNYDFTFVGRGNFDFEAQEIVEGESQAELNAALSEARARVADRVRQEARDQTFSRIKLLAKKIIGFEITPSLIDSCQTSSTGVHLIKINQDAAEVWAGRLHLVGTIAYFLLRNTDGKQ